LSGWCNADKVNGHVKFKNLKGQWQSGAFQSIGRIGRADEPVLVNVNVLVNVHESSKFARIRQNIQLIAGNRQIFHDAT
jgi:hypothetical protein